VLTGPTGAVTQGSVPVFRRDMGTQQSFLCNAFISRDSAKIQMKMFFPSTI